MAGGVNPFGFSMGVLPAPRAPRQPKDLPSAPFGFAPPPSKMQQTLAILNEYNPLPAFERLLKSPMALGGPISERDIADGLTVAGTVTGGSAAAPKPRNALNMGIRAYHGSPHDFDAFSLGKIGTGEGAQAYGHGLYFADSEGVARTYKDLLSAKHDGALSKHGLSPGGDTNRVKNLIAEYGDKLKNPEDVIAIETQNVRKELETLIPDDPNLVNRHVAAWEDKTRRQIAYINDPERNPGRMYEVEINADPDTFLDWDKPLSEQPEAVRKAVARDAGPEFDKAADEYSTAYNAYMSRPENPTPEETAALEKAVQDSYQRMIELRGNNNLTGAGVYHELAKGKPWALGSEELRKAGIPGIKYLDAGSRGAGDGTRNYVVFDDKLISIVKKYGIAGASAMLGYNILDGVDPAQAEELKRIEGK